MVTDLGLPGLQLAVTKPAVWLPGWRKIPIQEPVKKLKTSQKVAQRVLITVINRAGKLRPWELGY